MKYFKCILHHKKEFNLQSDRFTLSLTTLLTLQNTSQMNDTRSESICQRGL